MKRKEPGEDGAPPPENPAVFLKAVNEMAIEQFDLPPLGPHDVRVAVKALGICQSDVHYLRHGRIADFVLRAPMVIGHECAGQVVDVGDAVSGLKPGDRVALEPGIACLAPGCRQCLGGEYNLCPAMRFFATPPVHGALARYINHPAGLCFPVPQNVSYEEAAMVEPLSVGVYACTKAELRPGQRVLITGAGPIGLVTLLAARAFGASEIAITDLDEGRLALAAAVAPGVVTINAQGKGPADILEAMEGEAADVVFDCAGFEATVSTALETAATGGKVVLIGMGCTGRTMQAPLLPAAIREVDLVGSFRYRNTYATCLSLIASGRIDVKRLITHRLDLDLSAPGAQTAERVTEGFAMAEKGGEVIKVMFHLWQQH